MYLYILTVDPPHNIGLITPEKLNPIVGSNAK